MTKKKGKTKYSYIRKRLKIPFKKNRAGLAAFAAWSPATSFGKKDIPNKNSEPHPIILFFHGYQSGTKTSWEWTWAKWAKMGYVLFGYDAPGHGGSVKSVKARLINSFALLPELVPGAQAVLDWIAKLAYFQHTDSNWNHHNPTVEKYKDIIEKSTQQLFYNNEEKEGWAQLPLLDLNRVYLVATSAGGFTALRAGFTRPWVNACIGFSSVYDWKIISQKMAYYREHLEEYIKDFGLKAGKSSDTMIEEFKENYTFFMEGTGMKAENIPQYPELDALSFENYLDKEHPLYHRVELVHCRDDRTVYFKEHYLEYVKDLDLPADRQIIFEEGDHRYVNLDKKILEIVSDFLQRFTESI